MSRWQSLLWITLGVLGCSASLPRPMTAEDLVHLGSSEAVLAYLGQPDASPTVCDPHAVGPHLARLDDPSRTALVRGLTDGTIAPLLWSRCIEVALDGADAASLLDAIAEAYVHLIEDHDIEGSPALQTRLATMQALYAEHATLPGAHPGVVAPVFEEVRTALARNRLGPVATRFAGDLLTTLDLGQGRFRGKPVDGALIDALFTGGDEVTLRRFVDLLPSRQMRDQARRRVVQLAIARSPYEEVRADARQIEQRVLQTGFNRVLVRPEAPEAMTATLDVATLGVRGVLVRQDIANQTATVLGDGPSPGVSVLPALSFGGALWLSFTGASHPITVCQPARQLDPSPCIDGDDVELDNPLVYRERGGSYRFVEHIGAPKAVALARASRPLRSPIRVGGRQVATLALPLRFERPKDVVFTVATGSDPTLHVTIDHLAGSPFVFTVSPRGGRDDHAIVEERDLPAFHIVSRGAAGQSGMAGSSGWDGMAGMDGSSASCPFMSGSDGSPGGNGSDGGAGGDGQDGENGGDIDVEVECGAADCSAATLASLRNVVVSEGGPGGSGGKGGSGGRGGSGGSGGSGASCTDDSGGVSSVAGGNAGLHGGDGTPGMNGSDGRAGRPGVVRFIVGHR